MPKPRGHVNAAAAGFRPAGAQAYDIYGTPLRGWHGGNSVRDITIPGGA